MNPAQKITCEQNNKTTTSFNKQKYKKQVDNVKLNAQGGGRRNDITIMLSYLPEANGGQDKAYFVNINM